MPCVSEVTPSTTSIDLAERERNRCDCPDCKAAKAAASNFFDFASRCAASIHPPEGGHENSPLSRSNYQDSHEPNFVMSSLIVPGGGLAGHESKVIAEDKPHPLRKHVEQTIRGAFERLAQEPKTQLVTRFYNRAVAEHEAAKILMLEANQVKINEWLQNPERHLILTGGKIGLKLEQKLDSPVAWTLKRARVSKDGTRDLHRAFKPASPVMALVLAPAPHRTLGWEILTMYAD